MNMRKILSLTFIFLFLGVLVHGQTNENCPYLVYVKGNGLNNFKKAQIRYIVNEYLSNKNKAQITIDNDADVKKIYKSFKSEKELDDSIKDQFDIRCLQIALFEINNNPNNVNNSPNNVNNSLTINSSILTGQMGHNIASTYTASNYKSDFEFSKELLPTTKQTIFDICDKLFNQNEKEKPKGIFNIFLCRSTTPSPPNCQTPSSPIYNISTSLEAEQKLEKNHIEVTIDNEATISDSQEMTLTKISNRYADFNGLGIWFSDFSSKCGNNWEAKLNYIVVINGKIKQEKKTIEVTGQRYSLNSNSKSLADEILYYLAIYVEKEDFQYAIKIFSQIGNSSLSPIKKRHRLLALIQYNSNSNFSNYDDYFKLNHKLLNLESINIQDRNIDRTNYIKGLAYLQSQYNKDKIKQELSNQVIALIEDLSKLNLSIPFSDLKQYAFYFNAFTQWVASNDYRPNLNALAKEAPTDIPTSISIMRYYKKINSETLTELATRFKESYPDRPEGYLFLADIYSANNSSIDLEIDNRLKLCELDLYNSENYLRLAHIYLKKQDKTNCKKYYFLANQKKKNINSEIEHYLGLKKNTATGNSSPIKRHQPKPNDFTEWYTLKHDNTKNKLKNFFTEIDARLWDKIADNNSWLNEKTKTELIPKGTKVMLHNGEHAFTVQQTGIALSQTIKPFYTLYKDSMSNEEYLEKIGKLNGLNKDHVCQNQKIIIWSGKKGVVRYSKQYTIESIFQTKKYRGERKELERLNGPVCKYGEKSVWLIPETNR